MKIKYAVKLGEISPSIMLQFLLYLILDYFYTLFISVYANLHLPQIPLRLSHIFSPPSIFVACIFVIPCASLAWNYKKQGYWLYLLAMDLIYTLFFLSNITNPLKSITFDLQ